MKLDDKYTQLSGSVYLTGMQALVRLPSITVSYNRNYSYGPFW